ncbi:MAG: hypothetical protein L6R39_003619, partial [Caloplaca ligustica]
MSLKRKRQTNHGSINGTGSYGEQQEGATSSVNVGQVPETPSKRRRGRPPGSTTKPKPTPDSRRHQDTPRSKQRGKGIFETPTKTKPAASNEAGNPIVRNADRSARRRSARTLVERTIAADDNIDEDIEEESSLAKRIWDADEADEDNVRGSSDEEAIADPAAPVTPSKRGRKGPRRKRTPTPPQDLPSHEQYFFQN